MSAPDTDAPHEASGAPPAQAPSPSASRQPSLVMRAVEKTADRLSRSKILSSNSSSSGASTPQSVGGSSRRLFSRTRRKSHTAAGGDGGETQPSEGSTPLSSSTTVQRRGGEESPFVRPPSPAPTTINGAVPVDPYASLRAGTQTLIQALQAIPWAEDADDADEAQHSAASEPEPLSDEDSDAGSAKIPLSSSIHTIHRPVARSKRAMTTPQPIEEALSDAEEDDVREGALSDSGPEDGDFEREQPAPEREEKQGRSPHEALALIIEGKGKGIEAAANAGMRTAGSMATVRRKKRAQLADKLREVFELEAIKEVVAEMPCWLFRSIMLQGYMYLTNSHLCFFAHMPSREDQVLKSGPISKKTQRTRRWIKHWFVLKNDALSWYQSSADPYFPHGVVDLRYVISCEATGERDIRIRTNQKTILLSADSVPSREEWVKALRRAMFKAQHSGENVRIAIPYSAILDVERSHAMDFSETIEVKVVDQQDHLVVDSYFFAYFADLGAALRQIREAIRAAYGTNGRATTPQQVMDTTLQPTIAGGPVGGSRSAGPGSPRGGNLALAPASTGEPLSPSRTGGFRLSSLWRGSTAPSAPAGQMLGVPEEGAAAAQVEDSFTHVQKRGFNFVPLTLSPKALVQELLPSGSGSASAPPSAKDHTYPPSPTESSVLPGSAPHSASVAASSAASSTWTVGVPSWLRIPGRASGTPASGATRAPSGDTSARGSTISEAWSAAPSNTTTSGSLFSTLGMGGDLGYSILETPHQQVDAEALERFKSSFALGDDEKLLGYFPGWLYRLIPIPGRLYISTSYVCFRATGPLTSKTRMIIPVHDILNSENSRAFHFGHYGLVLNLRGYEELFFEFGHEERRRAFAALLDKRKEEVLRRQREAGEQATEEDSGALALTRPLIFEDFEPGSSSSVHEADTTSASAISAHDGTDPMFTSASSTFLRFKPERPLHFTFLTIGSRGDVQPYIALAKGLMADGHKVRIATHGEFREWIEAQGIEFGFVGGDPAELMRICVENGMFTVSFLKEGLQKFRGWLDDLFKTSWEACQGTDVLVESPSAMAGYHIAEALKIPYFRAFTMTWSRTRAYPHAFAVPEHKMGGSYNYMTYVMFDQVFWRAIAGQVNRWRRRMLKLPSTNLDLMEPHKIPFLYNFSPTVVPPPLDWPDWIRITGYWFLDDADVSAKKWTPPPDLLEFIDAAHNTGKKVVYIGFGSIVVSDPRGMTRIVVEAIERSGVYAILSKGWSDRLQNQSSAEVAEPEPPLPKQVYPISSIPHDWLFQRIDAACHHGGAGTTGASLRAGIPTIIRPFFGDQFFWANRVEALGIGAGVRKLTVEALTEALVNATTDQKQIDRAKLVGEQIRSENGVANAIQSLYRDMDYARSLIKRQGLDDEPNVEAENATIRDLQRGPSPADDEADSLYDSPPPSSDWSMIEEGDHSRSSPSSRRPSVDRRRSTGGRAERPSMSKRSSLVAGVLSVLPDALSSPPRPTPPRSTSSPSTNTVTNNRQ